MITHLLPSMATKSVIFAEAAIDPHFLSNTILLLALALSIGAHAVSIFGRNRTHRVDASILEGAATQPDLEKVKRDCQERIATVNANVHVIASDVKSGFEKIACQLRESETRILDKDEERSVELHNRLNEFEGKLGEVRGELKARGKG